MTGASDMRDLYQEVIIDHGRNPRNFGKLENANRSAEGDNPMCGDRLTVYLHVNDDGVVEGTSFEGHGCAISTASASLMTEMVKGRSRAEALALFRRLHEMATGQPPEDDAGTEPVDEKVLQEVAGKLEVLSGVREYPMRVKCATLPWHTMKAAMAGEEKTTTE
jgi:nitrogen fixation protein NifU and related proteins